MRRAFLTCGSNRSHLFFVELVSYCHSIYLVTQKLKTKNKKKKSRHQWTFPSLWIVKGLWCQLLYPSKQKVTPPPPSHHQSAPPPPFTLFLLSILPTPSLSSEPNYNITAPPRCARAHTRTHSLITESHPSEIRRSSSDRLVLLQQSVQTSLQCRSPVFHTAQYATEVQNIFRDTCWCHC